MNTFWSALGGALLGKNDPGLLVAALIFAIIGHALILLWGTTLRDPASKDSPPHFSIPYLLKDNAKRIFSVLLLMIVSIRFSPDLFNMQVSAWGGFLVGAGLDSIALVIKQKTKILDPTTPK